MTYVTFQTAALAFTTQQNTRSQNTPEAATQIFPTGAAGFHFAQLARRDTAPGLTGAEKAQLASLFSQLKAGPDDATAESLLASIEALQDKTTPVIEVLAEVVETTANTFAPWVATHPEVTEIQAQDEDAVLSDPTWRLGRYYRSRVGTTAKDVVADNPENVRKKKIVAIDAKTREIIAAGFQYGGMTFSLSPEAQVTWIGMYNAKGNITPVEVGNIDDTGTLVLNNKTEVDDFYEAAQAAVLAARTGGLALKKSVMSATTEAGVDAIVDTR